MNILNLLEEYLIEEGHTVTHRNTRTILYIEKRYTTDGEPTFRPTYVHATVAMTPNAPLEAVVKLWGLDEETAFNLAAPDSFERISEFVK